MIYKKPNNGDTVFEYVPQNLKSGRKCYIEHKWKDLAYFNQRLNAGLLYKSIEDVEKRIKYELQFNHRWFFELDDVIIRGTKNYKFQIFDDVIIRDEKEFQKQYMCDWGVKQDD